MYCMFGESPSCNECVIEYCSPTFEDCAGYPDSQENELQEVHIIPMEDSAVDESESAVVSASRSPAECPELNTWYDVHFLVFVTAGSWAKCAKECVETCDCGIWSWSEDLNGCYLKNATIGKPMYEANVFSGSKSCTSANLSTSLRTPVCVTTPSGSAPIYRPLCVVLGTLVAMLLKI
eukprot:GEMP01067001.1.p1 GENE.GEMP01067001.1~~GEMP01067001.1.p1  ORF type:complete len:178 (+),score=27.99 GEMP01067001.1:356-889(+)